ncbi:MAG: hypothetical protein KC482_10950 [Dehalococcoidia bacterium]|nr:hypothetical protein [Dehalococcoidia bacterium]MCA9843088.1 hypothetical protein [Dehalococcoidia bacterium]MCA9854092.1 hypothetical protein [Dehalococcoidia bacterium]
MPKANGTLKAREFLFACEDRAMAQLPSSVPQPERKVMWTILQLHYGDPFVHFEIQPQVSRGQVELGLHFEGVLDKNEEWAQRIANLAAPIAGTLGPAWELEEWTASWRRLHRVFHFDRLTSVLASEVAEQYALLIGTLHPVVREGLEVIGQSKPHQPAPSTGTGGRRWQRQRARR